MQGNTSSRFPSWYVATLLVVLVVAAVLLLWTTNDDATVDPTAATAGDATPPTETQGPVSLDASPRGPEPKGASETATRRILGRPAPVPDGPAIRGVVVDPTGTPIVGARVVAFPDTANEYVAVELVGGAGEGRAENFTDRAGRFVVEAVGVVPLYGLVVQAHGFALGSLADVRVGADVRVVLDAGLRITGRVLTMDGEPIAGATVTALATEGLARVERTTQSGTDGGYALEGLPASPAPWGSFTAVRATKEGYALQRVAGLGRPVPGRPREHVADLVLVRGATVVGTVVDDETGRPIGGAHVVAWMTAGAEGKGQMSGATSMNPFVDEGLGTATSAADGSFRLEHVPANGFHTIASSSGGRRGLIMGYVSASTAGTTWGAEELPVVADGATIEATLRLRPAASIVGRVVDETGRPVAGARVHAFRRGFEGGSAIAPPQVRAAGGTSSAKADADGVYRLPVVPAAHTGSSSLAVTARAPAAHQTSETATATTSVDVVAGEEAQAPELVLKGAAAPSTGAIEFVVRDPNGAPIGGATLWPATGGTFLRAADGNARTGRDGRLTARPPRALKDAGPPTIRVRAHGFATSTISIPTDATQVEVTLLPGRRLAGRVVTAEGSPAAHTSVAAYDGTIPLPDLGGAWRTPAIAHAMCDTAGRFEFDALPPGPHHVVAHPTAVRRGGSAPATLESVPDGTTDVVLTLPGGAAVVTGRILLRVVDGETHRPLGSATLALRRSGRDATAMPTTYRMEGPSFSLNTSAPTVVRRSPGEFETDGGEPGTYDLTITAPGYVEASVPGVVLGAADVPLAPVLLSRGVRLFGLVTLPDGAITKDLALQWARLDDPEKATAAPLTAGGRFEATGFRPGAHRVHVGPTGFRFGDGGALRFLPAGDGTVVVPHDVSEFEVNLTTVRAGTVNLQLMDDRLPRALWMGGPSTPEQTAFGKASSLTLLEEDGTPVRTVASLEVGLPLDFALLVLRPGTYVFQLTFPGGETDERRVTVEPGVAANVRLGAKAPATR